ncbi:unnamed protein product [Polarella glacialis]|uniref:Uncharacterized protein n=1 Tax=Polarella glacialis TaxID=89957 RepID=A0A813DCW9_POLGL|nr:unnamed protein product [Polarella glacialis]
MLEAGQRVADEASFNGDATADRPAAVDSLGFDQHHRDQRGRTDPVAAGGTHEENTTSGRREAPAAARPWNCFGPLMPRSATGSGQYCPAPRCTGWGVPPMNCLCGAGSGGGRLAGPGSNLEVGYSVRTACPHAANPSAASPWICAVLPEDSASDSEDAQRSEASDAGNGRPGQQYLDSMNGVDSSAMSATSTCSPSIAGSQVHPPASTPSGSDSRSQSSYAPYELYFISRLRPLQSRTPQSVSPRCQSNTSPKRLRLNVLSTCI